MQCIFRPIATVESDAESEVEKVESIKENQEGEQSGIVSESVSASSVILMFGGTGKFKKTPGASNKESEEGIKIILQVVKLRINEREISSYTNNE